MNQLVRIRIKQSFARENCLPQHTFQVYLKRETLKAVSIILPQSMVMSENPPEKWIPKSCIKYFEEV